ncbi:MAG: chemotaxis protein CheB [Pseudohongiellaceae bacterium]
MGSSTAVNSRNQDAPVSRIVGIGASAGGLAALEQFLEQTPPDTGMAWIVVQHLDPTHKALLPELLQRVTRMPVSEVTQGIRIKGNHVYVIPPNTELSVVNSSLNLAKPAELRGMRLPINILFSSLASYCGEHAIAVILSGMGSDGTLGAQAIKAAGGLSVVQEPTSAQFDSMPKSVIAAGCADIIAPAAELPARILAFVKQLPNRTDIQEAAEDDAPTAPLQKIMLHLQRRTRHDFSLYKTSTLLRRIERRMAIHSLPSLARYAGFLGRNDQEVDLLFKELLIGVTSFFRDPAVWNHLAKNTLPELLTRRTATPALRVWSIGCSTGEEAYSLAMVFTEVCERQPEFRDFSLQIFASDLSSDAITIARQGHFPPAIKENISPARLAQFFTQHDTYYQINQNIRDMVLFARHDVALNPPFTRLDMIVCRNLLIYFDPMLQRRLLPLFHYSLRPDGILLLGSSETIGRFHDLFVPVKTKLRIYRRQNDVATAGRNLPVQSFPPLSRLAKESQVSKSKNFAPATENLQAAADHVLLQVYAPAAVVVNRDGDIVYISGRTGKYLEPAAGKATWNFHAMVREGLRAQLATALKQSALQTSPLQLHGLRVTAQEDSRLVDVTVQALQEPAALQGMTMIVFRDLVAAPAGPPDSARTGDSSYTAIRQQFQDEIQALRDESRSTGEELQSTNEELQSTNEELQSANEELTTSREEMQSMNEELQTINSELQSKLDDLALAQNDLQNTLNSVEIAILFLDQKLNVRRFTDRVAKIFSLRESDLGRPLSDLNTSLLYPSLHEDALATLRTLMFSEKEIPTNDGRWFSIRIMPYRRLDNMIDGVVITLVDISTTKKLEAALREQSVR